MLEAHLWFYNLRGKCGISLITNKPFPSFAFGATCCIPSRFKPCNAFFLSLFMQLHLVRINFAPGCLHCLLRTTAASLGSKNLTRHDFARTCGWASIFLWRWSGLWCRFARLVDWLVLCKPLVSSFDNQKTQWIYRSEKEHAFLGFPSWVCEAHATLLTNFHCISDLNAIRPKTC